VVGYKLTYQKDMKNLPTDTFLAKTAWSIALTKAAEVYNRDPLDKLIRDPLESKIMIKVHAPTLIYDSLANSTVVTYTPINVDAEEYRKLDEFITETKSTLSTQMLWKRTEGFVDTRTRVAMFFQGLEKMASATDLEIERAQIKASNAEALLTSTSENDLDWALCSRTNAFVYIVAHFVPPGLVEYWPVLAGFFILCYPIFWVPLVIYSLTYYESTLSKVLACLTPAALFALETHHPAICFLVATVAGLTGGVFLLRWTLKGRLSQPLGEVVSVRTRGHDRPPPTDPELRDLMTFKVGSEAMLSQWRLLHEDLGVEERNEIEASLPELSTMLNVKQPSKPKREARKWLLGAENEMDGLGIIELKQLG
jgi:hypothetical protein